MTRPDPAADAEVAAFLEAQPRELPYAELARLCRERFGPGRAWDEATIRRWWMANHRAFERSQIGRDRELREFVRGLAGRLTGPEIMALLRERFPPERRPSRTALYRFLAAERRAALRGP